jgi:hypothetical protein
MGSTDFSSASVEFKDGKAHIRTCFTAGTLIHTKDGTKNIEDIKVGDVVLSWNEVTGKREYKEVTELFLHEVELLYELSFQRPNEDSLVSIVDETKIETTWNHPFWVVDKKEWVEVRDLKVGDRVLLSDGKEVAISGIKSYNVDATRVYNFEVADNHTYFVGEDGVLVHNYRLSTTDVKAIEASPAGKIVKLVIFGGLLLFEGGKLIYNSLNRDDRDNNDLKLSPGRDTSVTEKEAEDMRKKGMNPLDKGDIRKYIEENRSQSNIKFKFLHPETSLSKAKMEKIQRMSTSEIIDSLKPGLPGESLLVKPDGTIMNGNHRLFELQRRGIDIDKLNLPREVYNE